MTPSKNERRLIISLLINDLPRAMRDALLADPAFRKALGVSPKYTFPLTSDLIVDAGSLHNALRAATVGRSSTRVRLANKTEARAKLDLAKNGSATLQLKGQSFSFADADILSADPSIRTGALRRVFKAKPLLAAEEKEWQGIAKARALTDREYVLLMTDLGATPEAFANGLKGPQNLDADRMMPDEARYYDRLLAPLRSSSDLSAFIANELEEGRRALSVRNPRRALRRIAYSALWQPLIPFGLFSPLTPSDISALLEAHDPFSLLRGFELCRAYLAKDAAFAELGTSFLQRLFAEEGRSQARCQLFSACATISAVNLRRAAKASNVPVFWVRLAAFTHAGVLTDGLGDLSDAAGFFGWVIDHFGPTYIWHGTIDRRDAPRWRPDWISPDNLFAELLGRAMASLNMVPEANRPVAWVNEIAAAMEGLVEAKRALTAFFPGPFDDFQPLPGAAHPFAEEIEAKLAGATRLDDVPGLFAVAYATRLSEASVRELLRILSARVDEPIAEDKAELRYLGLCAHIAATARSEPLARAVINRCLYKLRTAATSIPVTELLAILMEACAAHADPRMHRALLGQTAAKVTFVTKETEPMAQLEAVFDVLRQRDPKLAPALAQASAVLSTGVRAA